MAHGRRVRRSKTLSRWVLKRTWGRPSTHVVFMTVCAVGGSVWIPTYEESKALRNCANNPIHAPPNRSARLFQYQSTVCLCKIGSQFEVDLLTTTDPQPWMISGFHPPREHFICPSTHRQKKKKECGIQNESLWLWRTKCKALGGGGLLGLWSKSIKVSSIWGSSPTCTVAYITCVTLFWLSRYWGAGADLAWVNSGQSSIQRPHACLVVVYREWGGGGGYHHQQPWASSSYAGCCNNILQTGWLNSRHLSQF